MKNPFNRNIVVRAHCDHRTLAPLWRTRTECAEALYSGALPFFSALAEGTLNVTDEDRELLSSILEGEFENVSLFACGFSGRVDDIMQQLELCRKRITRFSSAGGAPEECLLPETEELSKSRQRELQQSMESDLRYWRLSQKFLERCLGGWNPLEGTELKSLLERSRYYGAQVCERAFRMVWREEGDERWKALYEEHCLAREAWEAVHPEYMAVRPAFEAWELIASSADECLADRFVEFYLSQPELAAWNGNHPIVHDSHELEEASEWLPGGAESPPGSERQARVKRAQRRFAAFLSGNSSILALHEAHLEYESRFILPVDVASPDDLRLTPDDEGFRDLRLPTTRDGGSIEVRTLTDEGSCWTRVEFGVDARLSRSSRIWIDEEAALHCTDLCYVYLDPSGRRHLGRLCNGGRDLRVVIREPEFDRSQGICDAEVLLQLPVEFWARG